MEIRSLFSALLCAALLITAGCAAGPDYGKIHRQLRSDNCEDAVASVENRKERYGWNQKLLFLMDAAMVNLMCSDYDRANKYFHLAEEMAENLWTRSISREATSFLWNEYTKPYAGEDFERVMINLFSAISYMEMDELDEALVEFRRLNALLWMFNEKYEKKNVYKEDAFARYLSGILYEAIGKMDDAFIDYLRAYKIFKDYGRHYNIPMPPMVEEDLWRTAVSTARTDEVKKAGLDMEKAAGGDFHRPGTMGKVVFIQFKGRVPGKIEEYLVVATPDGPVKIAFPAYAPAGSMYGKSTFFLESAEHSIAAEAYPVEDIHSIAVKNLEDRRGRVMAKAVARAAAKQLAFHQAAKEAESELVRIGLNFANLLIERADTRSWQTLPAEIHLARTFVPPGDYQAYVGRNPLKTITVEAGETQFILCAISPGLK